MFSPHAPNGLTRTGKSTLWTMMRFVPFLSLIIHRVDKIIIFHAVVLLQMNEFSKYIEEMAAKSLRCVAFAFRKYEFDDVPPEIERETWLLPEDELILTAIVGIKVYLQFGKLSYMNLFFLRNLGITGSLPTRSQRGCPELHPCRRQGRI